MYCIYIYIYISTSIIPNFLKNFYLIPQDIHFILVIGDDDHSFFEDIMSIQAFTEFIEDNRIISIFSQNNTVTHPKVYSIPIGLDYHSNFDNDRIIKSPLEKETMIKNIIIEGEYRNIKTNNHLAYGNFQLAPIRGKSVDRLDALASIPTSLIYYQPTRMLQFETFRNQNKYIFVVSPFGNGYDCHRTWEALVLNCYPIVKTSPLDILYLNLPVLIVNNWADVTLELLNQTIKQFRERTFDLSKLTLNYWINMIKTCSTLQ